SSKRQCQHQQVGVRATPSQPEGATMSNPLLVTTSLPAWGRVIFDVGPHASREAERQRHVLAVDVGRHRKPGPVLHNLRRLGTEDPKEIAKVVERLREVEAEMKRAARAAA